jgi:hypothetical protein
MVGGIAAAHAVNKTAFAALFAAFVALACRNN